MDLTPYVKKYIEHNHELLEKDFDQFVDNFMGSPEDFTCFLNILQNTLNEYTDLDSKIKEYTRLLQTHALDLEKKYTHVAGIIPFLYSGSPYVRRERITSINELFSVLMIILFEEGSSILNALPQELKYSLKPHYGNVILTLEDKEGNSSAKFVFGPTFEESFGISELYTKKKLPTILNKMEDLYRDIDSKFDDCVKSIQWKIEAKNITQKLVDRMNSYDPILENTPFDYHCNNFNNEYITINYALSRKTKIDLSIKIPFDSDPNLTDWDKEFENWTKKVDKFKQNQEKSALRKQEKEAQKAQQPPNVKITRKDVTNAIKAAGFTPSTFVYTNKYSDTTTYKYAFMTLTPDECDKIKTELAKTGANIKNVTCEQGWWNGRGAYNSLFVRVYN